MFYILGTVPVKEDQMEDTYQISTDNNRYNNKTQQFLMKVANRIFINRTLLQMEIVVYLLGYNIEFANNKV